MSSVNARFDGLRVVAFEARMSGPLAEMIARHGGVAVEAPALREVPLADQSEAREFVDRLLSGGFDVVLFETGVGVRYLARAIEDRVPREEWVAALARTTVVARGPKPSAALREFKARVDVAVPEPNTWHETLAALDAHGPVAGLRVAVQEYGKPNADLVEGLERRGAAVTRVPVYRWAFPDDTGPLRAAIAEISGGRVGAVLFTAAQQVEHLLRAAGDLGLEADVRTALGRHTVVGSIGPTTSEALRGHGLPVDIEPEHPKMGHLVAAVAAGWRDFAKG